MKARTFTNTNTNTNTNSGNQRKEAIINSFSVWGVKAFNDGGHLFNLNVNEMTIYGCSIKATHDDEAFVSMPRRKGRDGKWYPIVSCKLPEAISDEIITAVYNELDKAGGDNQ